MQLPKTDCKWCGSRGHYQSFCRRRPQKPLKRTAIKKKPNKYQNADKAFKKLYLEQNPPDEWGYYTCYLQTTHECPIRLLPEQVTIEHKIPKGSVRGRNLRFNADNMGIACFWCNSDKGSQDLELYLEKVSKRGFTNVSGCGSIDTWPNERATAKQKILAEPKSNKIGSIASLTS